MLWRTEGPPPPLHTSPHLTSHHPNTGSDQQETTKSPYLKGYGAHGDEEDNKEEKGRQEKKQQKKKERPWKPRKGKGSTGEERDRTVVAHNELSMGSVCNTIHHGISMDTWSTNSVERSPRAHPTQ
jgi:hypothetical protein